MRQVIAASALAGALIVTGALPALAWHVETGKHQQKVRIDDPSVSVKDIGPREDPRFRFVVKVGKTKVRLGACVGWVRLPEERWSEGWSLRVDGKVYPRGFQVPLLAGKYVAEYVRWDMTKLPPQLVVARETTPFSIKCIPAALPAALFDDPVKVKLRFKGQHGIRKVKRTIPQGCTWRSRWYWLETGSRYWLRQVQPDRWLIRRTVVRPDYANIPAWRGYPRGITCG